MPNWKKLITSGSNAELNNITASGNISASGALISSELTASGLNYPNTDGTDGQTLHTDGAGNLTFEDINQIFQSIKNKSGQILTKGTPVYASGSSGNAADVYLADANIQATMPASFIVKEDIAIDAEGKGVISGFINGIDTSTFNAGETIYVAVGGGYTNVKPTGSALIQNVGKAVKIDASNGSLVVIGAGRSNDVPNIPSGYAWVGNSDSIATAVATSSFVVTNANTASYVAANNIAQPFSTFEVDGPSNSHVEVGTYPIGYDTIEFSGFLITGSGLIVSGAMADSNHHNFLKIGEMEIVDVKNALNTNLMLVHNVDDFIITSGSDGGNLLSNILFRHQGNAFDIYQNGASKISMNSNSDLSFNGSTITFTAAAATKMKATNTTATNTYILTAEGNPNSTPQSLQSIDAQDFFKTVTGAVTASAVSASGTSDNFFGGRLVLDNAKYIAGTETGGTTRNILSIDGSNITQVANGNLATNIKGTSISVDNALTVDTGDFTVTNGNIRLQTNNTQLTGKTSGGAERDIIGFNASDVVVVGNTTTDEVQLTGNTKVVGNLTLDDSTNVTLTITGSIQHKFPDATYAYQGELSPLAGTALTAGEIYHYSGSGWVVADASDDTATKHLGVAVSSTDVMIRGYIRNTAYAGLGTGNVIYLSTTAGDATITPPSTAGEYVRVLGYCVDGTTRVIYFNPSQDWIEL